jgi:hypothetical protein
MRERRSQECERGTQECVRHLEGVSPVTPGAGGLPPSFANFPGGLPLSFPGLPAGFPYGIPSFLGSLSRLDRSFPNIILPQPIVPRPTGASRHAEHNNRNYAENQELHGVIDEGRSDLFRKILTLQDGGFLDGPAFGKALDVQILGIDDAGFAVQD